MTSLRRLAEEQGRPLPPESAIRDAIAAALPVGQATAGVAL
jgi:hypothetical protein